MVIDAPQPTEERGLEDPGVVDAARGVSGVPTEEAAAANGTADGASAGNEAADHATRGRWAGLPFPQVACSHCFHLAHLTPNPWFC